MQQTCKATTKAGTPCRAHPGRDGLCFLHANPQSVKSLAQMGDRQNRKATEVEIAVPSLMTHEGLCDLEVQVIRGLLAGKIKARDATAFARLCDSLKRILPTISLEARVTALEKQTAEQESELASHHEAGAPEPKDVAPEVTDTEQGQEQDNESPAEACSDSIAVQPGEIDAVETYREEPEEIEVSSPADGSSSEASDNGVEVEKTSDEADEAVEP